MAQGGQRLGLILFGRLDRLDPYLLPMRHSDWVVLGFLLRTEPPLYDGNFVLGGFTLTKYSIVCPLISSHGMVG